MKILSDEEFVINIKKNFDYLFISGFKITQKKHEIRHVFWVILDGKCRIKIGSDIGGHVYLSLAALKTPKDDWQKWYHLPVVIYMLTGGKTNLDYLDSDLDQDFVLKTFSEELQSYFERIFEIFTHKNLSRYEREFIRLRQEMTDIQIHGLNSSIGF